MGAGQQKVVMLGECMLELQGEPFGQFSQAYGGDTFNTAIYLARCMQPQAATVSFATALGCDPLSEGLLQRWAQQGLSLELVRQIPGKLPGLYMIELDEKGERSFHFWRDSSAARRYFDVPQTPLETRCHEFDLLYLSGISLAILSPAARERVFALMAQMRALGAQVVFDNNYRPALWTDPLSAYASFARAYELASMALITLDDHQQMLGVHDAEAALAHAQKLTAPELVIKRGEAATLVRQTPDASWQSVPTVPVPRVVDTTAAGDSFGAGYISRRLRGESAPEAAAFGNRLAARVIQHRGAIIKKAYMQDLLS